jgi:hypothetical protein
VRVIQERVGGIVRRVRLVDQDGEPVGVACRLLDHLNDRGLSPNTLRAYGYDLMYLFTFLAREGMDNRDSGLRMRCVCWGFSVGGPAGGPRSGIGWPSSWEARTRTVGCCRRRQSIVFPPRCPVSSTGRSC